MNNSEINFQNGISLVLSVAAFDEAEKYDRMRVGKWWKWEYILKSDLTYTDNKGRTGIWWHDGSYPDLYVTIVNNTYYVVSNKESYDHPGEGIWYLVNKTETIWESNITGFYPGYFRRTKNGHTVRSCGLPDPYNGSNFNNQYSSINEAIDDFIDKFNWEANS